MRKLVVNVAALALVAVPIGAALAVGTGPTDRATGQGVTVDPADVGAVGGLNVLEPAVVNKTDPPRVDADPERALREWNPTSTKPKPSKGG
jgi:hypothetical protein